MRPGFDSRCGNLCIGGSVVEFSPATQEARVRFPANAGFMFAIWAMSFWKWRLGHPGLVPSEKTRPHLDPLEHLLVSIVVSIPACHAGDRGSIPRRGGKLYFASERQPIALDVCRLGRNPVGWGAIHLVS